MYRVIIQPKAGNQLKKISLKDRRRIVIVINDLAQNPFAGKKLEGEFEGQRSIRVWPYRFLYMIDQKIVTVTILKIGHRQGVYS